MRQSKSGPIGVAYPRLLGAVALAAFGAVLAWFVITRGLARNLAEDAPAAALNFWSAEPDALVRLATEAFDAAKPGESSVPSEQAALPPPQVGSEAGELARSAIAGEPLNPRAFVVLGQVADRAGDKAGALAYMRAATQRSLRESGAMLWLLRSSAALKDYDKTVFYADALLRARPDLLQEAVPTLVALAENADERGRLVTLLAANSGWRPLFFSNLGSHITDARTPLNLFVALRDGPAPPTTPEIKNYLDFLLGKKFHELAYYTWLQFLPPRQLATIGLLFNASFEEPLPDLPFNWTPRSATGVTIDVVPRADQNDQRALFAKLGPGRIDFTVSQIMVLAPASYELGGKWKGEVTGKRGLEWVVACLGEKKRKPLGETPVIRGEAPDWTDFSFSFTVPATDCRAQVLRLKPAARSPSEQLVSGSAWFDDLRLTRKMEPPPPPPEMWPGFTSEETPP